MTQETIRKVKEILLDCVVRALKRTSAEKKVQDFKPFHEALLSKEIMVASSFERSFSTSFGQGPIEEISMHIALEKNDEVIRQYRKMVNINQSAVGEIERILSSLDANHAKPNWESELRRVLAFKKGDFVVREIISDLWVRNGKNESYISLKTVKPNKDQAKLAKNNMLLLKAHDETYDTYFSLYYNPGGPAKSDYNWSVPNKFFSMRTDRCVLIGQEYWDFIGGVGTYEELLEIFKVVGEVTQKQLTKMAGH